MKKLAAFLLLAALAATAVLRAAENVNIDPNLAYMRPTPNGLIGLGNLNGSATILDLRYFPADAKQAGDWLSRISDFVTPSRPCLLLISPETSPAILKGLGTGIPGVITIGRNSRAFHPDIAVDVSAESDHAAWGAIGKFVNTGNSAVDIRFLYTIPGIEKLLTPVIDKPRNDEAALAKEHAAELAGANNSDSSADDSAPADAPDAKASTSKPKSMPLIDAVLLRAVQIDRGLIALKKL